MQGENPTGEPGASISERLENMLAAEDSQQAEPEVPEAPEASKPQNDEQDADTGPQILLSDVAKVLGIDESALDVSEDGGVILKTKVDGQEGKAKLADLLKSYQLQGHVDAKAREAAETQKQLAAQVQQFENYARSEASRLAQLSQLAQQELMQDAARVNWEELARDDPAEYVKQQHAFQQRQARVNQLTQTAQHQQTQWQQAQQARESQALSAEAARLPTLIPEWADESARETGKKELRNWLVAKGANQYAIDSITDASIVAGLRAAMLAENGKTVAEKMVRTAPKIVKPGQSVDAKTRGDESLRDLRTNIRKSGGKTGIADYLIASGKV